MGRRNRGHRPSHAHPSRDERLTARQVAMARHRLFVEEFELTFGPVWAKTLWRAVDRRMVEVEPSRLLSGD